MAEGLDIRSEAVASTMGEFKGLMGEMEGLLSDIKSQIDSISGYWEGDDSEMVKSVLDGIASKFDSINQQNTKYVSFLNSTIDAYTEEDNSIASASSSGGLDIN